MNTEQERAEFEAWYEREYSEAVPCGFSPHRYYLDARVQLLYRCWGAARAALQSQDREDAERLRFISTDRRETIDRLAEFVHMVEDFPYMSLLQIRAAIDHARRAEEGR